MVSRLPSSTRSATRRKCPSKCAASSISRWRERSQSSSTQKAFQKSRSSVSSLNPRSVAADSNVLLSAVAGKAARRVFEHSELIVVTTEQNIAEVHEYIPEFAARYGLPQELLLE